MSERVDSELVQDLREAIGRILSYTDGMTAEAFGADIKTQDAVMRNLEILGEATKKLSEEFRADYPAIPWKQIAGMRDRLIHHYFGVNLDIVWQIVMAELPNVLAALDEGEGGHRVTS